MNIENLLEKFKKSIGTMDESVNHKNIVNLVNNLQKYISLFEECSSHLLQFC